MNKTIFQKLLSAIPLRPKIAIIFCFIIGYLGMFFPMGYLDVTYTDNSTVSEMTLPIREKITIPYLGINYCLVFKTKWLVEPNWYIKQNWTDLFGIWAIMLPFGYFMEYVPNSYKKLGLLALAFLAMIFVPIPILMWLEPTIAFECYLHETEAVVHGISIEWFKILSWAISLPLGIYALIKRDLIAKSQMSS